LKNRHQINVCATANKGNAIFLIMILSLLNANPDWRSMAQGLLPIGKNSCVIAHDS